MLKRTNAMPITRPYQQKEEIARRTLAAATGSESFLEYAHIVAFPKGTLVACLVAGLFAGGLVALSACYDWDSLSRGRYAGDGDSDHDAGDAANLPDGGEAGRCAASADFAIRALNEAQSAILDFEDAGRTSLFLQAGMCPIPLDVSRQGRMRAYVASNLTDASATLSAWLVCADTSAAYLAFYAGSNVPLTDVAAAACATAVAGGGAEVGQRGSPEANGSGLCPALTEGNEGGLALGPCESAVIYIQDRPAYPNPIPATALRVELQAP
jgi:hypothetical protein